MTGNPMDLYEAAAFYRSAALRGEAVTGHEYDAAFTYWDDTDFSNIDLEDATMHTLPKYCSECGFESAKYGHADNCEGLNPKPLDKCLHCSHLAEIEVERDILIAERDALARIVWQLKQKSSHV